MLNNFKPRNREHKTKKDRSVPVEKSVSYAPNGRKIVRLSFVAQSSELAKDG